MSILDKYRSVVVDNNHKKGLALAMELRKRPVEQQRAAFSGTRESGYFYLFADEKTSPGVVYECVASLDGGDAITSVYVHHPIFNSPGALISARTEMIRALADKVGLSVESVGIDDPGRGRVLGLQELGTGQLIDLLAERMGQSIVTTNTHSAADIKVD